MILYPAGHTHALTHAVSILEKQGCKIADSPACASHILLPVPSFAPDGAITGGGHLEDVLCQASADVTVLGGNLNHPALSSYKTVDFLKDPFYLAENANITAHCTLQLLMEQLTVTLAEQSILIIGWGRIAKCLARLLGRLDAQVTIAARKETDRAAAQSLQYKTVNISQIDPSGYRAIINTAPEMVLPHSGSGCRIDLASKPGMGGPGVIWARGLPNKLAPESSGALIARTVIEKGVSP